MTLLWIALAGWTLLTLVYRALALHSLHVAVRDASSPVVRPSPGGTVALLRPLRGATDFFEPCLASLIEAGDVADSCVLAGVASRDDPAYDAFHRVRDALASDAELRVSPGPAGSNRKVANLIQLARSEKSDFQLLTDADIRVPPDYVARMLAPFSDERVGLTTCGYRSVPGNRLASRLDAIAMNTQFLPSTQLAVRFEGVRFALGASVAVRRSALEEMGGFESLVDEPGDDYALSRGIADAGWKLGWAPILVDHHIPDEGLVSAFRRQLRWMRVTRSVRFAGYLGYAMVTHTIAPALLAGLLLTLMGFQGWLLPLAAWGAEALLLGIYRRDLDVRWRDLALVPLADLLALSVFAASIVGRPFPPEPYSAKNK